METIKYLLSKILFLIPIIIIAALLYKLSVMLVPFLPKTFGDFYKGGDILPPPGSWGNFSNKNKVEFNVHTNNNQFSYGNSPGSGNSVYATFDEKGNVIYKDIKGNIVNINNNGTKEVDSNFDLDESVYGRSSYVRNLSIFENGHIYTGLRFVGEAKGTMFNNGTFPVYVVDAGGRILAKEIAIAQEKWAVPGWVRFEVKVNSVLPVNIPCRFVFQAAPGSTDGYKKVFVTINERCN